MRTGPVPDGRLNVGFIFSPVVVLGPGRRVGLWLRGCSRRCPGCISPELWSPEPADWRGVGEALEEILGLAARDRCGGLTVSGGEPFEQGAALGRLFEKLVPAMPDILVFTGRKKEEWEDAFGFTTSIACLVDGPFEEDKTCPDAWRGSSNQNMIVYSTDSDLIGKYEKWRVSRKGALQLARPVGRVLGIPFAKNFGPP